MTEVPTPEELGPRGLVRRMAGGPGRRVSLCVMVTKWGEYAAWRESFTAGGFTEDTAEFLVIDNSESNQADAYVASNEFLQAAGGEYVVLLHQDVRLLDSGFDRLITVLDELTEAHPEWGVCGNAGARADSWPVLNLSHPWRERHVQGGPFPARVMSVDENFMVVRRVANLALSRDLSGFHHYAADLCLIADLLGWGSYVIDFYLRHESGGTFDGSYATSRRAISAKYARAFRSRWVELVTNQPFYIGSGRLGRSLAPGLRKARKGLGRVPRTSRFDDPDVVYPPPPPR